MWARKMRQKMTKNEYKFAKIGQKFVKMRAFGG